MTWTTDHTETAKSSFANSTRTARRIVDFMDERLAGQEDPHNTGKALTGPMLGGYWRYRIGDCRIICGIQDRALCIRAIELGDCKEVLRV